MIFAEKRPLRRSVGREIRLKSHPVGLPRESDFELATVPISTPGAGEVLVRNLYMSVDPYMGGRILNQPSYVQPFQLGQPFDGGPIRLPVCPVNKAFARSEKFMPEDQRLTHLHTRISKKASWRH